MHVSKSLAAIAAAAALAGSAAAQCSNYNNSPNGTLIVNADDGLRTVGLPFAFPFNGVLYNAITVCSNGWIKLGAISSTAAELTDSESLMLGGTTTAGNPDPRIAVCWDDLNASGAAGVHFAADATQATICWTNVIHFGQAAALANCECILQPSGAIYLRYDASCTYNLTTSSSIVGISKGGNAVAAGTHLVDWTTATPGPIPVVDATAYQLFTAATGLSPFDLHGAGVVLQFTPTGTSTYDVTNTTLPTCPPATFPPVASATTTSVGAGCPAAVPNGSIYELFTVTTGTNAFDLSGVSLKFQRSGASYSVVPGAGFDSNYTTNGAIEPLGGDDVMINYPLTMGTFPFGTANQTSVSLSSNGYVWMGASTTQQFNSTAASFNSGAARVAVYWKDLVPNNTTAPIYIENTATYWQATWENVPHFTGAGQLTAQVRLDSNGDVSLSYLTATGTSTASPPLVGITGGSSANLGNDNLATGGVANAITRSITAGVSPMTYTVNAAPRLGLPFVMTSTIPAANVGIGAFLLGSTNPNLPFDNVFGAGTAPGCTFYTDIVFEFFVYAAPGISSFSTTVTVPYDLNLAGLSLQSQAFGFVTPAVNSSGLVGSNGRSFTTGI